MFLNLLLSGLDDCKKFCCYFYVVLIYFVCEILSLLHRKFKNKCLSKEITLAKAKKITTEKNMNFIFISNILLNFDGLYFNFFNNLFFLIKHIF